MAAPVIQFKRGLFANLPGLRAGEPGFTTDKYDLYVGIDSTTSNNKFFGSHRYWTKETTTAGSAVRVVEGTNNGTNYIELKAPATIANNLTYTLPGTATNNGFLKTDGSGNLSWDDTLDSTTLTVADESSDTTCFPVFTTAATGSVEPKTGTNLTFNSDTGALSATSFVGSGSGLSAGTTPLTTLDIDGGTDIGADLVDADLIVVDDGAGGTNRKSAMSRVKSYVLGGGSGATFAAINVTGIATVTYTDATNIKASGVGTVTAIKSSNPLRNSTGDGLIPGVGVITATSDAGLVTAFKFRGNGLQDFIVADGIADVVLSGVAATTFTSSQTTTATEGQTAVTVSAGYDNGFIDVYLNGIRLITGTDYTQTNSTTVTLATGATAGDEIETVAWKSLGDVVKIQSVNIIDNLSVTGITTATGGVVGNVTGNVTGNLTGTADVATSVTVSANNSTNETVYPLFVDGATGSQGAETDTGLTYNPSTGALTSTSFVGNLTGNVTGNTSGSSGSCTGNAATATALASARTLGGVSFDGTANINLPGVNATGDQDTTGNAATATEATNVTVSANNTTNETVYPIFVDGATGTQGAETDTGLTYNPSTGALTAATFTGSGVVTGSAFHTGAEGSAIRVTSNTISGPATITLDPAGVGDNTGKVTIAGDLQVDGTTTTVNSTTMTVDDKNLELGTGAANDAAANGGGLTIVSGEGNKTFNFEATGDNLGSSENLNVASGKAYKINNTSVLNATTLGSSVVASSLTSVGTIATGVWNGTAINDTYIGTIDNANKVALSALDIDGATDIGAAVVDADLFIVDDGAGGTNRKVTASRIKSYIGGYTGDITTLDIDGGTDIGADLVDADEFIVDDGGGGTNRRSDLSRIKKYIYSAASGDATASDSGAITLANSGVSAGTVGSGSAIPILTIDAKGRITSTSTASIDSTAISQGNSSMTVADSGTGTIVAAIDGSTLATFAAAGITLSSGAFVGNLTGNASGSSGSCTGNSATATALANARTIAGVSFDGTGNISLNNNAITNGAGYITSSGTSAACSGNAATATALANARTIGGVSFDGTGNINLPGVNATGDQDTTGNAATATVGTTITIADESSDTTCFPLFATAATGNLGAKSGTNLTFNSSSGALSATSFVGSGSGLTAGTTPLTTLDIDGGSDIGAGLADADLFIVDDGAGGTNKKTAASRIKTYIADVTLTTASQPNITAVGTIASLVASSAKVSDLTSGRVVLAGTAGEIEDSGNLTFNGSTLAVTGAATVSSNLTVSGNLFVNGTTTQVNTVNTTIEDTLLELQKVDGGNLGSDTNKDVGLVMNYYDGSAKKAAMFWDDSAGRFAFGSVVTETTGVLGSVTYGGVEMGSLYLNDCAGASQVISCSGTTRSLENITIDGGTFS